MLSVRSLEPPTARADEVSVRVSAGTTLSDPTPRDEDTRELWCSRCGGRLTASSDVCSSCGAPVPHARANRDNSPDTTDTVVRPARTADASDRLQDLERAVTTTKYQRSQLLKHLLSKDDELEALRRELARITNEQAGTAERLAAREREADALKAERQSSGRRRNLGTAFWLLALVVASLLSVGAFRLISSGPLIRHLAAETGRLRDELAAQTTANAQLLRDAALKDAALKALSGGNGRVAETLAAQQKDLEAREAALKKQSDALAQLRLAFDQDRQRLADARAAFEQERAAFEKRQASPPTAPPPVSPPPSPLAVTMPLPPGVMMWRGNVASSVGGITVVLTPNAATFGTLTNGAFPDRPTEVRAIAINGSVTVRRPTSEQDWGRLYMNVVGKGPVTAFLVWLGPVTAARRGAG